MRVLRQVRGKGKPTVIGEDEPKPANATPMPSISTYGAMVGWSRPPTVYLPLRDLWRNQAKGWQLVSPDVGPIRPNP